MKRKLGIFIIILLTLVLTACQKETGKTDTVRYYYLRTDTAYGQQEGVLTYETRDEIPDLEEFLQDYLSGPIGNKCKSPFPANVGIFSVSASDKRISVVFGEEMAEISGAETISCCACLTRTLLDAFSVTSIEVSIANNLINEETSLIFTNNSFQFRDFAYEYSENN